MSRDAAPIAGEDRARADLYAYLATFLAAPPPSDFLARSAALRGDSETVIGRALAGIAAEAGRTDAATAEREFNRLFIGLGRGEFLPFASYYLTGNLHDRPLARLRRDMARLGLSRAAGISEPEDHIASIFDLMAGLILGRDGPPATIETQRGLFRDHLEPWAGRFFAELAATPEARLYPCVGALGAAFMAVESRAFELA